MEDNFRRRMTFVFAREGGHVDDPRDPDGSTNLGITIATLRVWRGHAVTTRDVRRLDKDEATQIYHAWYWKAAWCGDLPYGIDLLVFDTAVNMGIQPSLDFLKLQIGVGVPIRDRRHPSRPVDWHLARRSEQFVLDHLMHTCVHR
jgi:lysozyme family protein